MAEFGKVPGNRVIQRPRVNQQRILPTAVKPASLAQTTLVNTQAEILGPFSLNDGGNISITSFITNTVNPEFRLGMAPYNIIFFEDSLSTSTIIGDTVSGYIINGPMSIPQFRPYAYVDENGTNFIGGNDGNNAFFLTEIINNTGNTHDIYAITDARVYTPIGGGVDS